jgi:phage terminase large subunit GpA-like protein
MITDNLDEIDEDIRESSSRYSLAIKRFSETDEFLLRHSTDKFPVKCFSP